MKPEIEIIDGDITRLEVDAIVNALQTLCCQVAAESYHGMGLAYKEKIYTFTRVSRMIIFN